MSDSNTPVDLNRSSGGNPANPEPVDSDDAQSIPEGSENEELIDEADLDSEEDDEEEDEVDNMMSMLPAPVKRRVEKLLELNTDRDKIMENYLLERAALEKKYLVLCKPLYEQRRDVISGKQDEEIEAKAKKPESAKSDTEDSNVDAAQEKPKGVPQFWVCAIGHMEVVAELVTERDVDCLEYLEDVTYQDEKGGTGFTLDFHFLENPYFTDKILTKKYSIPNLLLDDEPILKNVQGCTINWKHGQCLTHKETQKKQRSKSGRKAGQVRTVTKKEKTDSFFHFFSPPKIPSMNEMDEEEADAIEEAFDHDYDIAQAFRSQIIPKAVLWFTGEAMYVGADSMLDGEQWPGGDGENGTNVVSDNPFPSPAKGPENPECKQN